MNNTTLSLPLPGVQFLSLCYYFASFSTFFIHDGLIQREEQNQTVPILSALFQYLKQFNNESEAKIQFLWEIINGTDGIRWNDTLDMKGIKETYKYVIDTTLFFDNRIRNYLHEIVKTTENMNSEALREIMRQHLLDGHIINDSCSSSIGSSKFTALAVSKVLEECILPHIDALIGGNSNNCLKLKIHERSKRQPPQQEDDDDTLVNHTMQSMTHQQSEDEVNIDLGFQNSHVINLQESFELPSIDPVEDEIRNKTIDDSKLPLKKRKIHNVDASKLPLKKRRIHIVKDTDSEETLSASENENIDHVPKTSRSRLTRLRTIGESEFNYYSPSSSTETPSEIQETCTPQSAARKDVTEATNFPLEFRIQVNNLAIHQADELWPYEPINLWFTQSVTRNVLEQLRKLKGNTFFFNDVTVLYNNTDEFQSAAVTKVHYSLVIYSQYGFLDMSSYSNEFKNKFVTFPDVTFNVTSIHFTKEDDTALVLNLTLYHLTRMDWLEKREAELKQLTIMQTKGKSKRMRYIETAAHFISSNVVMYPLSKSINMLKDYLLELEQSTSLVPTYYDLAKDFSNNLIILPIYNEWKINPKLIEDVLFDSTLNDIRHFADFNLKIRKIGLLGRRVVEITEQLFNTYINSVALQESLRVDDFYLLHRYMKAGKIKYESMKKLFTGAIYRLALRQCETWCHENLVTIDLYDIVKSIPKVNDSVNRTGTYTFELKKFYSNEKKKNSKKSIDITLEMRNRAGVANLNILTGTGADEYIVAPGMTFPVNYSVFESVPGFINLVILIQDTRSKERKMIEMINKLYDLED